MIPQYSKKTIIASIDEPQDLNVLWLQIIAGSIEVPRLKYYSTVGWLDVMNYTLPNTLPNLGISGNLSVGGNLTLGSLTVPTLNLTTITGTTGSFQYLYGTTSVTAGGFYKIGGTSSQFLKANGSVDSTVYQPNSDNALNTQNKSITGSINEVRNIALGAQIALAYEDNASAIAAISNWTYDFVHGNIGQSIYIVPTDIPDLWISGKTTTYSSYVYTGDALLLTDLENSNYLLHIGYYIISTLESSIVNIPTLVPYTGATQNVNLGNYKLLAKGVNLPNSAPDNPVAGDFYYDPEELTVVFVGYDGTILQIGEENYIIVTNKTTEDIADGTPCYISGAQGNNPTANIANSNMLDRSELIGVSTNLIPRNQKGKLTTGGIVHGFNTTGLGEGTKLWLNGTNISVIKPTSGFIVFIGYTLNSTHNGSIFINPSRPLALTLDSTDETNSDEIAPTIRAVKDAIDTKANKNNPSFTGNVTGITKSMVGLGNVDNTADLDKPISAAAATVFNTKANINSPTFAGMPTAPTAPLGDNTLQLATTAFVHNGLVLKENSITNGTTSQYFRGDKTWQTLDKSTIGLSNVNNTSDTNKPISIATQNALDLKATDSLVLHTSGNETATGIKTFNGQLGIGTTPTTDKFNVYQSITMSATGGTSLYPKIIAVGGQANPSVVSTSPTYYYSLYSGLESAGANITTNNQLYGAQFAINHNTSGSLQAIYGDTVNISNGSTGLLQIAIGVQPRISNTSTGTIQTATGINIATPTNTGTINYLTGLRINQQSVGTVTSTPYALWQDYVGDWNYFAGNVGIGAGSSSQSPKLTIYDTTSSTGSVTTPLMLLRQTWNTTGAPNAIDLDITNTASASGSSLMNLKLGGVSKFRVDKSNGVIVQDGVQSAGTITATNFGLYLRPFPFSLDSAFKVAGTTSTSEVTSKSCNSFYDTVSFVTASGSTATFATLNSSPTINQVSSTGKTTGILINPTLTSAPNYSAIEMYNNGGKGINQVGTAPNFILGKTLFGGGNTGQLVSTYTPQTALHTVSTVLGDGLLVQQNSTNIGDYASIKMGVTSDFTQYDKGGIFFKKDASSGRGDMIIANNYTDDTTTVTPSDEVITIKGSTKVVEFNSNKLRVKTAKTPSSATDTGNTGDICWDANYVYVCVATNTWKRSALTTW